jgi:hypothetical protein
MKPAVFVGIFFQCQRKDAHEWEQVHPATPFCEHENNPTLCTNQDKAGVRLQQ